MSEQWPSDRAWNMLDELEKEPEDVGSLELDRLLDAWGVTECLPGADRDGYRARRHPNDPEFTFDYPRKAELSPALVRRICSAVHELYRRSQSWQNRSS